MSRAKNLIAATLATVAIGLTSIGIVGEHMSNKGLERPKKNPTEYSVSLHNHTTNLKLEDDKSLEAFVDSAFKNDLDVVALTDSDTDENFYYLRDNSNKILEDYITKDIGNDVLEIIEKEDPNEILYLIKGQEFHRKQGHILVIGYDGKLAFNEKASPEDVINIGKENNAIVIIPHPFTTLLGSAGLGRERLEKYYKEVDAIESFNAMSIYFLPGLDASKYNRDAKEFCKEKGIPGISSSDSRAIDQIGCAYMLIEKKELNFDNGKSLIDSVRTAVKDKKFKNYEGYFTWMSFVKFQIVGRINIAKGKH